MDHCYILKLKYEKLYPRPPNGPWPPPKSAERGLGSPLPIRSGEENRFWEKKDEADKLISKWEKTDWYNFICSNTKELRASIDDIIARNRYAIYFKPILTIPMYIGSARVFEDTLNEASAYYNSLCNYKEEVNNYIKNYEDKLDLISSESDSVEYSDDNKSEGSYSSGEDSDSDSDEYELIQREYYEYTLDLKRGHVKLYKEILERVIAYRFIDKEYELQFIKFCENNICNLRQQNRTLPNTGCNAFYYNEYCVPMQNKVGRLDLIIDKLHFKYTKRMNIILTM